MFYQKKIYIHTYLNHNEDDDADKDKQQQRRNIRGALINKTIYANLYLK